MLQLQSHPPVLMCSCAILWRHYKKTGSMKCCNYSPPPLLKEIGGIWRSARRLVDSSNILPGMAMGSIQLHRHFSSNSIAELFMIKCGI